MHQLCRGLAHKGHSVTVLTTDANGPRDVLDVDTSRETDLETGLKVRYCHRILDVSVSPALLKLLPSYIRAADVVHLTAVYSFPTIPTLFWCRRLRKPLVWSPRGMLQRWPETPRTALKALWETVCRFVSPRNAVLHCTSEAEAVESVARMRKMRVVVVPNGVEVMEDSGAPAAAAELNFLYLGRLHPIKGIENLLEAFSRVSLPASLTIAGEGDAPYAAMLKARAGERVRWLGAVDGSEKDATFKSADCVVVPSHTESFGMVMAEALAHGVPVIASKGTPWKRVEEIGCGLWVDNDPQSLADAMKRIASMPLREMGRRGREWMQREFSIEATTERMLQVYRELM